MVKVRLIEKTGYLYCYGRLDGGVVPGAPLDGPDREETADIKSIANGPHPNEKN